MNHNQLTSLVMIFDCVALSAAVIFASFFFISERNFDLAI